MMSAENPYQAPEDISSTGLPEAPEYWVEYLGQDVANKVEDDAQ